MLCDILGPKIENLKGIPAFNCSRIRLSISGYEDTFNALPPRRNRGPVFMDYDEEQIMKRFSTRNEGRREGDEERLKPLPTELSAPLWAVNVKVGCAVARLTLQPGMEAELVFRMYSKYAHLFQSSMEISIFSCFYNPKVPGHVYFEARKEHLVRDV